MSDLQIKQVADARQLPRVLLWWRRWTDSFSPGTLRQGSIFERNSEFYRIADLTGCGGGRGFEQESQVSAPWRPGTDRLAREGRHLPARITDACPNPRPVAGR